MILSQNYISRYFQKMPANKGQTLPTTLRTPLNYSEIYRYTARDLNLNPELAEKTGNTPKMLSLMQLLTLPNARRLKLDHFVRKANHIQLEKDPDLFNHFMHGCQFTKVDTI